MKKLTILILLAVLAISVLQCSDRENPVISDIPHGLYFQFSFTSDAITGDIMQDFPNRDVIVYAPPGYDTENTDVRYPVVYMLHGVFADHNYFRGLFNIGNVMDEMIYNGDIEPMLIVTPNATNNLGGSFYTNSPDFGEGSFAGNMEDFIIDEVVHIVDSVFNTIPDRKHRAIAGHSMGGYGAMKLAMLHSDMFGATASMSGPVAFWGTYPADQTPETGFPGVLALLPAVMDENNWTPGDMASFYNISPGPGKRITNMMFAMASAFSPHDPANPDTTYAHRFTTAQYTGYVDLPFDYTGATAMPVWALWLANDVTTMLASGAAPAFDDMDVYVDCGDSDDIYLHYHAQVFDNVFSGYVGRDLDYFEIYPAILNYEAGHTNLIGARLPYVFEFLDQSFSN